MKYYLEEINQAQSEYEELGKKLKALEKEYEACKNHYREFGWNLKKLKGTNLPPGYTMKNTATHHNHRYEGGGWELYYKGKTVLATDWDTTILGDPYVDHEAHCIELAHELYMKGRK